MSKSYLLMNTPKNCSECPIICENYYWVATNRENKIEGKLDDCPLLELLSIDDLDLCDDENNTEDSYCEWIHINSNLLYHYKTSCGTEDLFDNKYKFCPYCGKKIKVVN